jgi:hypothetical protein
MLRVITTRGDRRLPAKNAMRRVISHSDGKLSACPKPAPMHRSGYTASRMPSR